MRRRWLVATLGILVLLVGGALIVRGLLIAGLGGSNPGLVWNPLTSLPTGTPTPSIGTRYVQITATTAPSTQTAASATPGVAPSSTPSRVLLPLVEQGGPAPLPPSGNLTPEPTRAPATPAPLTPEPTVTPTPTRGPQRATKLGIGVYESGGAMIPDLDVIRPSVVLLQDPSDDFAREVRRMFPKAFIMGRIFVEKQPLDNPAAQGAAFADRVAAKGVPLKGVVDAWMSYNEIVSHDDYDNYRAYNTFQVAFAKRLQDTYGLAAVAGNDGTGTVEPTDYAKYFAEAIRTSKYFGIHSYAPAGAKTMRDPSSGYLVLRHRQIKAALDAAGVKSGPFVITESGLWDGWRGLESDESMAQDLTWFADELNKDPYVLGTTVFGLFGGGRWGNFNVAGTLVAQRMGVYNTEGGH